MPRLGHHLWDTTYRSPQSGHNNAPVGGPRTYLAGRGGPSRYTPNDTMRHAWAGLRLKTDASQILTGRKPKLRQARGQSPIQDPGMEHLDRHFTPQSKYLPSACLPTPSVSLGQEANPNDSLRTPWFETRGPHQPRTHSRFFRAVRSPVVAFARPASFRVSPVRWEKPGPQRDTLESRPSSRSFCLRFWPAAIGTPPNAAID